VLGTLDRLPVYEKGDGVLGLRYAVVRLACRDTRGSAGNDTGRHGEVLEDPATDVDVMGREVITWLYEVNGIFVSPMHSLILWTNGSRGTGSVAIGMPEGREAKGI
jgi:hypothetical protein